MAPEVIVADEPTAGLDPESTARLLGLLDRLHGSGRTVVISTHDVELALAWADHVLVLRRGELVGAGPPATVFADAALVREARLATPIVLEVYQRLLAAGFPLPDGPPPRTAAQLAGLVAGRSEPDASPGGGTRGEVAPG
jgi:cobalt/nickel transport system ATP-binding protein